MINLGHCDVNVCEHCNKTCVSCSHASPFQKPWNMTPEELASDLAAIRPFVHFHQLQAVGGEPTLNKQLPELLRVMRASGVGDEISVITNGELLRGMPDEFWKELDTLILSIYPSLDPTIPDFAQAKCEQFGKSFCSRTFTEFHRQFRTPPNDGAHFTTCHWRRDCWSLHRGRFYLCPQSIFFPHSIMGLEKGVDGLPVADLTEEKFLSFINREEPLNACRICMANEMKAAPWQEVKRSEWLEVSKAI